MSDTRGGDGGETWGCATPNQCVGTSIGVIALTWLTSYLLVELLIRWHRWRISSRPPPTAVPIVSVAAVTVQSAEQPAAEAVTAESPEQPAAASALPQDSGGTCG